MKTDTLFTAPPTKEHLWRKNRICIVNKILYPKLFDANTVRFGSWGDLIQMCCKSAADLMVCRSRSTRDMALLNRFSRPPA